MVRQQEDVRQAIDTVNQQFVTAFSRGDAAGAVEVYSEDATILPPGSPAMRGRGAIQQFWQGAMDMGIRKVTLRTDALQVEDNTAYELGSATLTIQPQGGQEVTDTVKYVVVWRLERDGWRWAIDIWNSNA